MSSFFRVFRPLLLRVLALGVALCLGILLTPAVRARVIHIDGSTVASYDPGTLQTFLNSDSNGGALLGQVGSNQAQTAPGTGVYGLFNAASGPGQGVIGAGVNGYGVVAEEYGGYFPALYAQNYSPLGAPAVQGVGNGVGVQGESVLTDAIVGLTKAPSSQSNNYAGVVGLDNASDTGYNSGVYGESSAGSTGVFGVARRAGASNTFAVAGVSLSSIGVDGESNADRGVQGFSQNNFGVAAFNQTPNRPALFVRAEAGTNSAGEPVIIAASANGSRILSLDQGGNVTISGVLTQRGSPLAKTQTSDGATVVAYGSRQSTPTTEDIGEGQLSAGAAYVPLDPQFRRTIDRAARYLVFITPQGESRNLYVTHKTNLGFAVQEAEGGHDSLPFDYRIVAKPFDTAAPRLPPYRPLVTAALDSAMTHSHRHGKASLHYRLVNRKFAHPPNLTKVHPRQ